MKFYSISMLRWPNRVNKILRINNEIIKLENSLHHPQK